MPLRLGEIGDHYQVGPAHGGQQRNQASLERGHARAGHQRGATLRRLVAGAGDSLRATPTWATTSTTTSCCSSVGHAQLRHGGGACQDYTQATCTLPTPCSRPVRRPCWASLDQLETVRQGHEVGHAAPSRARSWRSLSGRAEEERRSWPRWSKFPRHCGHLRRAQGRGQSGQPGGKTVITSAVDDERLAYFKLLQGQPGHRRVAQAVRPGGGHQRHRGHDAGRAGQVARGGVGRRLRSR